MQNSNLDLFFGVLLILLVALVSWWKLPYFKKRRGLLKHAANDLETCYYNIADETISVCNEMLQNIEALIEFIFSNLPEDRQFKYTAQHPAFLSGAIAPIIERWDKKIKKLAPEAKSMKPIGYKLNILINIASTAIDCLKEITHEINKQAVSLVNSNNDEIKYLSVKHNKLSETINKNYIELLKNFLNNFNRAWVYDLGSLKNLLDLIKSNKPEKLQY